MTDAEALRDLRVLIADQLRRPPGEIHWSLVHMMLWDVHYVLEGGTNPLIELRIRRYKRRAHLACP